MSTIPDPTTTMPNEYGTTVFLKNIVKAENIIVGDYTYYDDSHDPMGWERNNVLFNYPFFWREAHHRTILLPGRGLGLHHGGGEPQALISHDLSLQRHGRTVEGVEHTPHR